MLIGCYTVEHGLLYISYPGHQLFRIECCIKLIARVTVLIECIITRFLSTI